MKVQGLYAAVCIGERSIASPLYARLFGREPDGTQMPNLVRWRFGNAATGIMTIVVPDLAVTKATLAEHSIDSGPMHQGQFGKTAQIRDQDGNVVTRAEPPR